MKKSQTIWLLVLILIIATFLRFYHFDTTPPGLYPDEAIDGNNATEAALTHSYKVFYPEDNGREGLYVNIIGFMFQFFHAPHEPWVIRLPAAVAGVLTVLGLYFLVAELFGNGPGLFAAFLLATSFWHINFSRIGFRAILAPLLLTWSLYLFLKTVEMPSDTGRRRSGALWLAAIAGIVYALGFYTYIAYRITPLLFLLFIPFFRKYPDFWKRALLFIVATFLIAAPIGWYFAKNPADFFGRTSEIAVTNSGNPAGHFIVNFGKTLAMFNFHGDDNWRHNESGAPELFLPVGVLFIVGIVLGAIWLVLYKKNRLPHPDRLYLFGWLLTFAWFILAAIPAAASDEGIPHALRSILMLPPALIFAALAGAWLYTFTRRYWGRTSPLLALLFFVAVTSFAFVQYFDVWGGNPNVAGAFSENYVFIGQAINAFPTSTPKYVVVEAGGVMTRGLPMPAETTIFITDTFLPQQQAAKNVHYLLPDQLDQIPSGTPPGDIFYIQ